MRIAQILSVLATVSCTGSLQLKHLQEAVASIPEVRKSDFSIPFSEWSESYLKKTFLVRVKDGQALPPLSYHNQLVIRSTVTSDDGRVIFAAGTHLLSSTDFGRTVKQELPLSKEDSCHFRSSPILASPDGRYVLYMFIRSSESGTEYCDSPYPENDYRFGEFVFDRQLSKNHLVMTSRERLYHSWGPKGPLHTKLGYAEAWDVELLRHVQLNNKRIPHLARLHPIPRSNLALFSASPQDVAYSEKNYGYSKDDRYSYIGIANLETGARLPLTAREPWAADQDANKGGFGRYYSFYPSPGFRYILFGHTKYPGNGAAVESHHVLEIQSGTAKALPDHVTAFAWIDDRQLIVLRGPHRLPRIAELIDTRTMQRTIVARNVGALLIEPVIR